MLNRHGWAKKWPDLPSARANGAQHVQTGVFDTIFDKEIFIDEKWWSVDAVIECKSDRGSGRFPYSEFNDNQRRWITWRLEHNRALSAWIALVIGRGLKHPTQPTVAILVDWARWSYVEREVLNSWKSLRYEDACWWFVSYTLHRHDTRTPKGRIHYGWEIPLWHPFAKKFRLESPVTEPAQPSLLEPE